MMGRSRGRGRGRGDGGRADGSLRFGARDEPPPPPRRSSGWGVAPPSRHLWVGSLAPGVTASDLSELFIRCGEVEGIACDPGRSFAFVSLVREEDAVAAIRELQGARLHRAPIRIEFSKGVSVEHRPASVTLFIRCGEVEGIACDPGRSFAFVSMVREEDAVAAIRELQGARLHRAPIRIEFSKGVSVEHRPAVTDKSSGTPMDDRYTQYADERHFIERGRIQQPSPEKSIDKFKRNKSTEPSEVLWIGFPAGLKVDEATLWEPFSPFGEIAKITTFPGRTYAFVKYATAAAACRAKEALQGRLFNNPRVSICFSRNEGVAAEVGKGSSAQYLLHSNPSAQHIFVDQDFEVFPRPRDFDSPPRDLRISLLNFVPERLLRDTDDVGFSRDSYSRHGPEVEPGPVSSFELCRMQRLGPERTMSEDLYEQRRSSSTVRSDAPWHNIPFERPRRPLPLEDAWDAEDNSYPFSKKLRIGEVHDAELPEYPFSEFDQGHAGSGYPRRPFHDLPEDDAHPTTYQLAPVDGRNYLDPLRNPTPLVVRHEPWRSQNNFDWGLGKVDRSSPEHDEPLPKEEWKWNGTIAKGGTPICRARSFPVGKVLNFMLPEFVNCTARTNLEMLAKHYYEAASSWVVFFVPENDVDMAAYNDFMNYLGDKQRAAVCKLGERSTLFLVPPSDFSEKVLRVPGKVSISGVILKFQQSNPDLTSTNRQPEALELVHPSFASHLNSDVSSREDLDALRRPKLPDIRTHHQGPDYLRSSAGTYTPASTDFTPYKFENVPSYLGSQLAKQVPAPNSRREMAHDQHQRSPNAWPSHWSNNNDPSPGYNSSATSTISHAFNERTSELYSFATQGVPKGTTSGYSPGEASNMSLPSMEPTLQQVVRPQQPPSPPGLLSPEQLAQLAILLAQQNQRGKEAGLPIDVSNKQSGSIQNTNPHKHGSMMSDRPGFIPVHNSQLPVPPSAPSQLQVHVPPIQGSLQSNSSNMLPTNAPMPSHTNVPSPSMHILVSTAHSSVPLGSFVPPLPEGPPPLQLTRGSASAQPMLPSGQQIGQQLSAQEDLDGDPQKRLQATLQLAATLLQQIQNQSKPGGQK